jgi:hypothetical protein
MTLYEFNLLDINNQMETVNQKGVYLDNRINKVEKFNLYAVEKFFVEVENNKRLNQILKMLAKWRLNDINMRKITLYYGKS